MAATILVVEPVGVHLAAGDPKTGSHTLLLELPIAVSGLEDGHFKIVDSQGNETGAIVSSSDEEGWIYEILTELVQGETHPIVIEKPGYSLKSDILGV
jgi:hypothetical protein